MSPNNSTERHGFLNMSIRGTQWLNRRQTTSVQLRHGQNIAFVESFNNFRGESKPH